MFSLQEYLTSYIGVLRHLDGTAIERMAQAITGAWSHRRTVFFCGNGGSAASAIHLAADLAKLTAPASGPRLRVISLNENMSALSAVANDFDYAEVFAEQLRSLAQAGDVVVGLSTSGSSRNVLRAVEYANSIGACTIGITGRNGQPLVALARHALVIDSESVQHVEDATMVAGHVLCLRLRELFDRLSRQPSQGSLVPSDVLPSMSHYL